MVRTVRSGACGSLRPRSTDGGGLPRRAPEAGEAVSGRHPRDIIQIRVGSLVELIKIHREMTPLEQR